MFKRLFLAVAVMAITATASAAETNFYYGFHIGITNAPQAPKVVFREEPEVVLVAGTDVFMVGDHDFDCDVFHVGSYWYVMSGGYWYRARNHKGPFTVIDVRKVPRAVFATPSKHWRHHPHGGPPGQMKKQHVAKAKHERKHGRKHKH